MKILLLFFSLFIGLYVVAQTENTKITDSLPEFKNTIRWNITPIAVVGPKSFVFGYERIVKPYQSFSFNIGYLEKAPMTDKDGNPIHIFDQSAKGGFDFAADYRFYFKKRNKKPAPDGLYWGPYTSYYGIWQDATLQLLDGDIIKNTIDYYGSISMYSAGVQLGYQFVIKERFTIDLVFFGPSYTYYDINMKLKYQIKIDPNDPFYQNIIDYITNSNSFLSNVLKNRTLNANGRLKFGYYGFRYGLQIGYRF